MAYQNKALLDSSLMQTSSLSWTGEGYSKAISLAKQYVDEHYKEPINLDKLADLVGITRFSLAKQFRQQVGVSPYQYVCRVRIYNARALMEKGERPTEIAGAVGFFDQSHLAKHFKRLCGITPRQYRERYCKH